MARKPDVAVLATAPALPPASVDFDAYHSAIVAGASAEEAVAAGTGEPVPADPVEPETPDAPAEGEGD